jgi:transposase
MTRFDGLHVSQGMTAICVIDNAGRRRWQGQCSSVPEEICDVVLRHGEITSAYRDRDRSNDAMAGA